MPDTIGGLPLHPLIVHAAVVLLPLSAIGLLILIVVPRWRRTFGWLVLAGLLVSAGAAWLAKETGENLAETLGVPQEHAEWGERIVPIAGVLFLVAAVWYWRVRAGARGALTTIAAIVAAALAIASIAIIVVVGHTGAQAAWEGKMAAANAPAAPTQPSVSAGMTMADVASHTTAADCWSVVSGTVYDLTAWIAEHPGGPSPIESMCGRDATSAFTAQHGGQQAPEQALAGFEIGRLQ